MVLVIAFGLFIFAVVGSIIGVHVAHKGEAGILPGLVAGIWAAAPFFYKGKVQRYNFLHPVPRRYKRPVKHAFGIVRKYLDDKTYGFGDGWKASADTQEKRIIAGLKYTDEDTKWEMDGRGPSARPVRVQRFLKMEVQFKEEPNDTTVLQFDFWPEIDGLKYTACDHIIAALLADLESLLGQGAPAGRSMDARLPAPPRWLLLITGIVLLFLLSDVLKAVFK